MSVFMFENVCALSLSVNRVSVRLECILRLYVLSLHTLSPWSHCTPELTGSELPWSLRSAGLSLWVFAFSSELLSFSRPCLEA